MKRYTLLLSLFTALVLPGCTKSGEEESTVDGIPTVNTSPITGITTTAAVSGGTIISEGSSPVTARGICWSLGSGTASVSGNHTVDATTATYLSSITGLTANTTYYVRAYATNAAGTGYGNELVFTTTDIAGGTLTDIDGHVYNYIYLGSNYWMTENLNVAHYRNGDPIPEVKDQAVWASLFTGAWCWYNNDSATYAAIYGKLYNWYAFNDPRGLAPTGWRMPTELDWVIVESNLGGNNIAGGKLKEAGTTHWNSPNTGATNSSGFTGRPGGYRSTTGFSDMGLSGNWWSSIGCCGTSWSRHVNYNDSKHTHTQVLQKFGYSIRCVKE